MESPGVALLILENACPISPEADNNAKPYWKIRSMLARFCCRSQSEEAAVRQVSSTSTPAASHPLARGSRRGVPSAGGSRRPGTRPPPTPAQVPGAAHPLLTGAREENWSPGKGGAAGKQGSQKLPRGCPLTQTPGFPSSPPARRGDGGGGSRAGKGGEGGGHDSTPGPGRRSTPRAPEVRRGEAGRCSGRGRGRPWRLRRGEGGERSAHLVAASAS